MIMIFLMRTGYLQLLQFTVDLCYIVQSGAIHVVRTICRVFYIYHQLNQQSAESKISNTAGISDTTATVVEPHSSNENEKSDG